jgi:uncharacterized protein YjbI with pentapeptide repeats
LAITEHVALARQGAHAIARWRDKFLDRERLDLSGAFLSGARLAGADLANDDLSRADLTRADLRRADLSRTDLGDAHLWRSSLSRANLQNARLPQASLGRASLDGGCLREADLRGADLSHADLSYSDLTGADLSGADLTQANLSWADLTGARLTHARLTATQLDVANLTGVDLRRASLVRTRLERTLLADAMLDLTLFADCDLSQVLALESVRHAGPSILGLDSLARSRGLIPAQFLRLAGAAEPLIAIQPTLQDQLGPASYSRVLLVSSVQDGAFAQRLAADLRAAKFRCWPAPVDDEAAMRRDGSLLDRVAYYDRVAVVCSEPAMTSAHGARFLEQMMQLPEGPAALIALALDQYLYEGQSETCQGLRRGSVADFRGWSEDEAYQRGLARLAQLLSAG